MVMQPDSPQSPTPQYDFIMNPGQPAKKPLIPGASSKQGRIIIVGVGIVIMILLASMVIGLLNKSGKGNTDALVTAAKQQQELIRIAEIGVTKARSQDAKNIAITTKLSLESQQSEMQSAIKAAGLNPKKVLSSADSKTDEALTTAEQNNRFDEEFLKIMAASLTAYQKSVKAAYDGATGKKLKAALTTQYDSANTLAGVAAGTN
jgi:flagellar basal body-associated protein FliL